MLDLIHVMSGVCIIFRVLFSDPTVTGLSPSLGQTWEIYIIRKCVLYCR